MAPIGAVVISKVESQGIMQLVLSSEVFNSVFNSVVSTCCCGSTTWQCLPVVVYIHGRMVAVVDSSVSPNFCGCHAFSETSKFIGARHSINRTRLASQTYNRFCDWVVSFFTRENIVSMLGTVIQADPHTAIKKESWAGWSRRQNRHCRHNRKTYKKNTSKSLFQWKPP